MVLLGHNFLGWVASLVCSFELTFCLHSIRAFVTTGDLGVGGLSIVLVVYSAAATGTKLSHRLKSQKTPHTSPSQASYGVSFLRIWKKIDPVIMTPYCI